MNALSSVCSQSVNTSRATTSMPERGVTTSMSTPMATPRLTATTHQSPESDWLNCIRESGSYYHRFANLAVSEPQSLRRAACVKPQHPPQERTPGQESTSAIKVPQSFNLLAFIAGQQKRILFALNTQDPTPEVHFATLQTWRSPSRRPRLRTRSLRHARQSTSRRSM